MLPPLAVVLWAVAWVLALLAVLMVAVTLFFTFFMNSPKVRRMCRYAEAFPQPPAVPILGHLPLCFNGDEELFWLPRKFCAQYGHCYAVRLFVKIAFSISDPKVVEAVLSSSKHIEKDFMYTFLHSWLGTGLLTSSGQRWYSRRKLLTPAFHFRILEQFSGQLEHHADGLVDQLREASAALPAGEPLDLEPFVSRWTLMAICETAMGTTDFNEKVSGGADKYIHAIHTLGTLIVHRIIRPWLWFPPLYSLTPSGRAERQCLNVLHRFTEKIIHSRRILHTIKIGTLYQSSDF